MKFSEFKMVAGMAFRNLGRHRVKTIITVIAVAVSVSLYIFMDAWLQGMNIDSRRNIIIYEMGAAKIQKQSYFNKKDDMPMYESFSGWQDISKALSNAGYSSAPRFVFTGTMHSRTGTAPILFNAIDVESEKMLFRYPDYIDSGFFPKPGTREIALGAFAAEKLHLGIPERPDTDEFENEILAAAANGSEKEFIRSLYVPYKNVKMKKSFLAPKEDPEAADNRLVLKNDVSKDDIQKLWGILSATGRMDVRISTTIDIKALPERIIEEKFNRDIIPLFKGKEDMLFSAYTKDPVLRDFILTGTDEKNNNLVLSVLLEADYSGAVRHVNQLIDGVVTGIVNSPNPKTNSNIAYLPMDTLQDESGLLLNGNVTELLIRSSKADDSKLPGKFESPETILAALEKSFTGSRLKNTEDRLGVYSWKDYSTDYFAASAQDNVTSRIMIGFLFILSFLGIANTMLMSILERTKEIGMMRALGMTDGQLMLAYVTEAALVGVLGSIAGVIIGCLINIPMVSSGFDYSAMAKELSGNYGYRIAAEFKSVWNYGTIIGTFFVASLLSGLMAVLPTLRALKLPVTETLRFE
jgi:putative ABC transport system permease protein